MKYAVGDRIKLTDAVAQYCNGPYYEAPPGTTGVIVETKQYPCYGVQLDDGLNNPAPAGYFEHELERRDD